MHCSKTGGRTILEDKHHHLGSMNNVAFVIGGGPSCLLNTHIPLRSPGIRVRLVPRTLTSPRRKRVRSHVVCKDVDAVEDGTGKRFDPVEDGVKLPQLVNNERLEEESRWLERQLTEWLDQEWEQGAPQPIHAEIGTRTAQVYARQRMEGEDDLSSVLIAIGSELEGMDFSSAFVGPWNVANKTAEFLLEHRAGPRVKLKPYVSESNAPTWSMEVERSQRKPEQGEDQGKELRRASAPSLADYFEKLKFLRDVLDETASKELVDGAVAVAMGYRYDAATGMWDGSNVEDQHFKQFGDFPPDVLGDETVADYTETLKHLEAQLGLDEDDTGDIAKGLNMVIETLHGVELTAVQMRNESDHAFRKRVVVANWLHLRGGF